jgi:hypothetical protein
MSSAATSDQLVAGVFTDHAAGEAALTKLKDMAPQLSQAGVTGVLTVAKENDGMITTEVVDVPGASDQAEALVAKTRSALDKFAGASGEGGTPTVELGQALMPGAIAVGVFVPAGRAAMVEGGMRDLGAHVLTPTDLKRIGAGMAAVQGNGTLDHDGTTAGPAVTPPAAAVFDWHAEYTYSVGVQAFIYGFPYLYLAQCRYKWTHDDRDPEHLPYLSVGRFWHARGVLDATFQDGGCPNNDTMYSIAWIDLSEGPVILSHPEMGERYFSFQLGGMTSDNVDYVGQRTTGSAAGHFALIGPGWEGELPEGVQATAPAKTPWILCLGRTLVDGTEDVPNVRELQSQYRLTPLSLWGQPGATAPERRDVLKPTEVADDPLGPWKFLNALLVENPPPARHAMLFKQFGTVGIGPGLDPEAQPEVVKQNLLRAAGAGMQAVKQYFLSGDWASAVNGWRYPPPGYGRAGERDDFLLRSAGQAMGGIIANDPAEAVYLVNQEDGDGNKLAGDRRYELRFEHDTLPPVDSFWSLTLYKEDMNLVPNPANRYAVGDRSAGLRRDPDGALTISIQAKSPGEGQEANWLPCPPEGTWFLVLRLYLPRPEVVDATWECPPVRLVA